MLSSNEMVMVVIVAFLLSAIAWCFIDDKEFL